jgi:ABC-2 type transport system permease protein
MVHFWRERSRVMGFAAAPLVFWLIAGSGYGDLAFFFPGAMLLTVMFTGAFAAMSLIEERRDGFLAQALASPAPRPALAAGKILGGASVATLQGLLFVPFLPALDLQPRVWLPGALFLAAVAFTSFGFWLAWHSRTAAGFHAILNLLLMPLWMMSGALFPAAKAMSGMRMLMEWNPLAYLLAILRHALGGPSEGPAIAWGIAATLAAACFGLAVRAVGRPQRRLFQ